MVIRRILKILIQGLLVNNIKGIHSKTPMVVSWLIDFCGGQKFVKRATVSTRCMCASDNNKVSLSKSVSLGLRSIDLPWQKPHRWMLKISLDNYSWCISWTVEQISGPTLCFTFRVSSNCIRNWSHIVSWPKRSQHSPFHACIIVLFIQQRLANVIWIITFILVSSIVSNIHLVL